MGKKKDNMTFLHTQSSKPSMKFTLNQYFTIQTDHVSSAQAPHVVGGSHIGQYRHSFCNGKACAVPFSPSAVSYLPHSSRPRTFLYCTVVKKHLVVLCRHRAEWRSFSLLALSHPSSLSSLQAVLSLLLPVLIPP